MRDVRVVRRLSGAWPKMFLATAVLSLGLPGWASATPDPPVFRNARHQFAFVRPAEPLPDVAVADLDGGGAKPRAWRGKVVVIGFWASWCPPCLKELPALERLAATTDPDKVQVVAVSVDSIDAEAIRSLARRGGWDHVQFFRDPEQRLGAITRQGVDNGALPLYGLPSTYIIAPSGLIAGDITGPSDWTSPEARKLLAYLSRP